MDIKKLNKTLTTYLEAKQSTDRMLDGIALNKLIDSDLGFKVEVREVSHGIAFNANGLGNRFKVYSKPDITYDELKSVIDEIGNILSDAITEMENKILNVLNHNGFEVQKDV